MYDLAIKDGIGIPQELVPILENPNDLYGFVKEKM